jgi:hypothetical protein
MFEQILERLTIALDAAGIRYMIIGGQAILLYGEPRLTKDVDVTLAMGPESAGVVRDLAIQAGFRPLVDDPEQFVRDTLVLPAVDDESGIRIDFIFSFSPYERQAIARARLVPIGRVEARFAAPEDVVIQKIVAGRPRDIEDISNLLAKQRDLDFAYIERWLGEFSQSLAEPFLDVFRRLRKPEP